MRAQPLTFNDTKTIICTKMEHLNSLDKNLNHLVMELDAISVNDNNAIFNLHQKIEQIRYSRNKILSQILDHETHLNSLKEVYFFDRFANAVQRIDGNSYKLLNGRIVNVVYGVNDELEKLYHHRHLTYKKLDSSFNSKLSIEFQLFHNSKSLTDNLSWESNLNHALSSSKRYFMKKCSTLKHIRNKIYNLEKCTRSAELYREALLIFGQDYVEWIASEMHNQKKRA